MFLPNRRARFPSARKADVARLRGEAGSGIVDRKEMGVMGMESRQQTTQQGPFTYEDLLLTPEDGRRYEVLEGELVVSPAPTWRHQRIAQKLNRLLLDAEAAGYGYVTAAPTDVIFAPKDVAEPDLLFIVRDRIGIAVREGVRGAPDLAVEVLSEDSRRRDVIIKRRVYERHGVRHYWIVDPAEETVRVFELRDGAYGEPATLHPGQHLGCPLFPGLTVEVGTLFVEP